MLLLHRLLRLEDGGFAPLLEIGNVAFEEVQQGSLFKVTLERLLLELVPHVKCSGEKLLYVHPVGAVIQIQEQPALGGQLRIVLKVVEILPLVQRLVVLEVVRVAPLQVEELGIIDGVFLPADFQQGSLDVLVLRVEAEDFRTVFKPQPLQVLLHQQLVVNLDLLALVDEQLLDVLWVFDDEAGLSGFQHLGLRALSRARLLCGGRIC